MTRLIIALIFTSAQTLYVVIRNAVTGQVWNPTTGPSGAWENYNSSHWAQYAVALTEQAGSGFYAVAYPAGIAATDLSIETFYQQAGGSPTLGDAPATGLGNSQGQNLTAVGGDASGARTFQASLASMTFGAVAAGTLTPSSFPTNLTDPSLNAYAGLSVRFVSGALKGQGATIVSYDPSTGTIGVAAPFTAAPSAADILVIA